MTKARSLDWGDGEVQLGPVDAAAKPPEHRNPRAGKTKYPFEEMQVNQLLYVARKRTAVRDAINRFVKLHKAVRLSCWSGADGRTVVKRTR